MYPQEIAGFGQAVGPGYVSVPFVFPQVGNQRYGDFVGIAGQREFAHTRVTISDEPLRLVRPMQDVRRFAELAQLLRFPKSDHCACVRGLHLVDGQPTFILGSGPYEEVFATMNSQGLRFELSERQKDAAELIAGKRGRKELESLALDLQKRYGTVTVRQAVHKHCGGLPGFGDAVASYLIGMAAIITTSDGYVVFGRRARQRVSVNTGINLATSGGFIFDREHIEGLGFARFVVDEIHREMHEEVGLLGSDCAVTVLALLREIARAGSPEILALIEFFGTLRDFLKVVESNHHPEQDVDAIFALPLRHARQLVHDPKAGKVLQPKALAALIMLDRHLRANGS